MLSNETDPYVCFRRREVKNNMRKTRRCDSQSLDKLRKLRDEMQKARDILELVSSRERLRKESALLEIEIFQERIKVRKMKKLLGVMTATTDADASPEKKKKKQSAGGAGVGGSIGSTKIKIPLQKFRELQRRDSEMGAEIFDNATIEERVKRRRFLDDREGWLDFSEVSISGKSKAVKKDVN